MDRKSAVGDRRRQVLRSAEELRDVQPRVGWLLDLRQSQLVEPVAERHQGRGREVVQRRGAARARRPRQARPIAAGRS
jgi:hypothetical protein